MKMIILKYLKNLSVNSSWPKHYLVLFVYVFVFICVELYINTHKHMENMRKREQ